MRTKLTAFIALFSCSLSATAQAQLYLQTNQSEAFVAIASLPGISGPTNLSFVADGTLPADDEGVAAAVPIGFSFNYLGQSFTTLNVSSNGWIAFGTPSLSLPANVGQGNNAAPNNMIAPFWDDLRFTTGAYGVMGTAPNRIFVLQIATFAHRLNSASDGGRFQIWLYEGVARRFEVHYGGTLANPSYSASSHYEGPNGVPSGPFLACGTSCNSGQFNAATNRSYRVQIAVDPELTGNVPNMPRGAFPGTSASGQLNLINNGLTTANGVVAELYLSSDLIIDAGDALVASLSGAVALGNNNFPITLDVPSGQATGDFNLLLTIDPANAFLESIESDNLIVAAQRFATGWDFRPSALSVTNPGGVTPGGPVELSLTVTHEGVPLLGNMEVELYASSDTTFDAADRSLGTATAVFSGSNVEIVSVSGTMPVVTPGVFYPVVELDPNNDYPELNEGNNVLVGPVAFTSGPDFAIASVLPPAEAAPGAAITISTTIDSLSVPYTGDVGYRLWASTDTTLDTLADTSLGSFVVPFSGQPALVDARQLTFPSALPAGRYYVIGVIDSANLIPEVLETNNITASSLTIVNAPDFAVSAVVLNPTSVEIGQVVALTANARSLGMGYTGPVAYRVYLSPDNMLDAGDQAIYQGTVAIAGQASTPIAESIPIQALPGQPALRPGSYFAILNMDPAGAINEAAEGNNWLVGSSVLIRGADLVVDTLEAPATAFIGLPLAVNLTISNRGVANARNFHYAYYLSSNDIIRVTDQQIFVSASATIAANQAQAFADQVLLPAFTSTRTLYLGVIVNIFSEVPETSDRNNTHATDDPIAIVFPIPNLRGQIVSTATAAAAGEQLAITRALINDGVADAAGFDYSYYLSSNPLITRDDILLGSFNASLGQGLDDYGIDIVVLPSGMQAGNYYLGLILDPDGALAEVDEHDNTALGPLLPVSQAAIQFVTDLLPRATIGVAYEVGIYARGGALPLSYSVASGNLPPGLTLDTATGIIHGVPTSEGQYELYLRASSGSAYADKSFSLRVIAPTVPLAVVSPALPTAVVGRDYQTPLVAVGGNLPYSWSAVSTLPLGMTLSNEGVFSGQPRNPGNLSLHVLVRDALGNSDSALLPFNVITASGGVRILQRFLHAASVGLPYCTADDPQRFEVQGGIPPFGWSIVGEPPPGMTVTSSAGLFCGAPTQAGTFPFVVRAQDATGLFDTALFVLEVADGTDFALSSFTLPTAQLGQAYMGGPLETVAGTAPYTFHVVPGWGGLPPGLVMGDNGVVSGTPTMAGLYAFALQVVDGAMHQDVQPISITVEDPNASRAEIEGCRCDASAERRQLSGLVYGLGALGLLFLRRRRRRASRVLPLALATVLASVWPSSAGAQTQIPGTPYIFQVTPITYVDLVGPTVLYTSADDEAQNIPLPFTFHYYDSDYTSVQIDANGVIGFPGGVALTRTNQTPGTAGTPNNWIAGYWDDLRLYTNSAGSISHQTLGTAPSRTFTVEYRRIGTYQSSTVIMSFKIRLFEGATGRIEIDYGSIVGNSVQSASMGMEDSAGARGISFSAAACTNTCLLTDFAARSNMRVSITQDPGIELLPSSITAPEIAFLGAATLIPVQVQSLHGVAIGPFTVAVQVAADRAMTSPTVIGTAQASLGPFAAQTLMIDTVVPTGLGAGTLYYAAVADSANVINEVYENNNVLVAQASTRMLAGAPDLSVEHVGVDRSALDAGEQLTVYSRIRNLGGEPASNASIAIMLSSNPVISPQDLTLSSFMATLGPGQTINATTSVTIPAATNSGTYFVGTLGDPAGALAELSEANNGRSAPVPITIAGGTLGVLTTTLPTAYKGVAYVALVTASGGAAPFAWSISQGRLPTGIGILPTTGELYGRPSTPETQTFTVQVTASGMTATRQLTLTVSDPEEPLTIVTRNVPPAVIGQEYSFQVVATGGPPDVTPVFSATGLPDGITFSPAGLLMGTATTEASGSMTLMASAGGENATREVPYEVRRNANLLIVPSLLSTAHYAEPYTETLVASGGLPPITWLIQLGDLPAGMTLSTEGVLSGTPTQVGTFRLVIEARDAATGGLSAHDANGFELTVIDAEGFSIVTETLPDAILAQGYDQAVKAEGGEEPYAWKLLEGRPPEGLLASVNPSTNEFRVAGAPSEAGTFNFLLQVTDRNGRSATRAMALRVLTSAPGATGNGNDDSCGCSTTRDHTRGLTLALLAFALLLLRRLMAAR